MPEKLWTIEKIKEGFEEFFKQFGRYPTALEIDSFEGLPSSRQIQRRFGGLASLRKQLSLEIENFGIGEHRSVLAKMINQRGRQYEIEMEKILIDYFGEYFVHVEKPLLRYCVNPEQTKNENSKQRADFFVYANNYQFCIDVFYASNFHNLVTILNIKRPNYTGLNIDVYLVNMNDDAKINNEQLPQHILRRKVKFESNIKLVSKSEFSRLIQTFEPIQVNDK